MHEIKLTIDGKEVQLTEEQLKMLGLTKNRKNPFDRIQNDHSPCYFYINADGQLNYVQDYHGSFDDAAYNNANYFNDQDFAKQVSLHQTLYRKLLKFAYDNGYHDTAEWNGLNRHWGIYYNVETHQFAVDCYGSHKRVGYWFSSGVGAARAIDEVIRPFMREHPEFVW